MNENMFELPFDERVRLARNEINNAWPLLKKVGYGTTADEIVKRYGLYTLEGCQAILEPQLQEKQELVTRLNTFLESPIFLDVRIKESITNWFKREKDSG